MCGRFTQTQSPETIAAAFQLSALPLWQPRYNIAPTQLVATVLQTANSPERQFQQLRWGLIPAWAKDKTIGSRLINARAETVSEKPSFRAAFKKRRCLILADGFYEWQRQENGKQPFYFRLQSGKPFAFAGLWECWQEKQQEKQQDALAWTSRRGIAPQKLLTCTILTIAANALMQQYHHRMPVILKPADYDCWLDPTLQILTKLQPLLQPYPLDAMTVYPVSKMVNKPSNESPECLKRLTIDDQQLTIDD